MRLKRFFGAVSCHQVKGVLKTRFLNWRTKTETFANAFFCNPPEDVEQKLKLIACQEWLLNELGEIQVIEASF